MVVYAKPRGGLVKVVENESHLWEEIYNGGLVAKEPRIFVLYLGETARGEFGGGDKTAMERVDRHWMVVIMRGHGFKNLSAVGQGQPDKPGYIEAFSDSCETVRDGCRVLKGISEEFPVDYKGLRPLAQIGPSPTANIFLDCKAVEFDTAADIPSPVYEPD